MKKRVLFCLATLGAASMLFGFDSAETADSLMEKMQEVSTEAEGATMDMDFNVNVGVNIGDGTTTSTLNMAVTGGFDIAMNLDPVAMSMDGSMKISAMGQNEEVSLKLYGVTNGDQFDTYTYTYDSSTEEGGWEHEATTFEGGLASLMEKSAALDLSDYGIEFELAPEAEDVDGTECYLLTTVIDSDTFGTILSKTSELTGQDIGSDEDVQAVLDMMDGIKIRMDYYVDAATYYPVKFHMDMNDSDMTALNQYAAMALGALEDGTTVTIDLNDISFDAVLAYGDANDITVPEEALESAVEVDSSEVLEEVADDLEVVETEIAE
jgi:FlaG/FlaF family flagellin (archaellin)